MKKNCRVQKRLLAFIKVSAAVMLTVCAAVFFMLGYTPFGVIFLCVAAVFFAVEISLYGCRRTRVNNYRKVLLRSCTDDIDKMDGETFEQYLEALFIKLGYKAVRTQYRGDYGVDLILRKDGKKIAVQAKRYTGKVAIKAVQEIYSGAAYYGAEEAWVVTNSDFTAAARQLAEANGVTLIGREKLTALIEQSTEAKTSE